MLIMRVAIIIAFAAVFAASLACSVQSTEPILASEHSQLETVTGTARQPILVELFTSEGCSSCPPADKQLAFLEANQPVAGADIITLAFHVDYWDGPGWKDAFSSAAFSERQNEYVQRMKLLSSYTPQMVVDGETELVGSDGGRAAEAITNAAKHNKTAVEVKISGDSAEVLLDGLPDHKSSTVYLAIAEDGLTSEVKGGENGGRKLSHISVVRKLDVLGQIAVDDKKVVMSAPIHLRSGWKKENLKIVIFAQENDSGRVIAVGRAKV